MTRREVVERLRSLVDEAGGPARWATRHGVSPGYVRDVLAGSRLPAPSVLEALGLRKIEAETRYEEARS